MSKVAAAPIGSGNERLACFVCDIAVVGRYYALANCRTQVTKIRLIEKLGQLVGDDYMVVVSEDDIICRGCATMINSLDRLEKELTSLRSMVLQYLEKKYDLDEGELVNTRSQVAPKETKPEAVKHEFVDFQDKRSPSKDCQRVITLVDVSAVTHANMRGLEILESCSDKNYTDPETRKRRAMCGEVDTDDLKDTKDALWLQCDRCKYTTHQTPNSSLQQISRAPPLKPVETKSVVQTPRGLQADLQHSPMIIQQMPCIEKQNGSVKPTVIRVDGFGNNSHDLSSVSSVEHIVEVKKDPLEGDENVEMITADIGHDFQAESPGGGTVEGGQVLQMDGGKQMTLQSVEGEDGPNTLCMVDENGIIVQKVEQAEDGTFYVQMADSSDPTKQMLSVAEDGSVQMVEVLWGDDIGQGNQGKNYFPAYLAALFFSFGESPHDEFDPNCHDPSVNRTAFVHREQRCRPRFWKLATTPVGSSQTPNVFSAGKKGV